MAQMGMRDTEENVSIKPSAVAQAGATRPLTRLSGDQFTRENRKVALRRKTKTIPVEIGNATTGKYKSVYSGSVKTYTLDLVPEFYYTSFLE